MTEINTQALKKDFHQDIIDLYKKITKIMKYKPTRLMDFINKYGGYEAAVKYINTESHVQDFAVLWEGERLDLSVEALITCDKYRPIFNEELVTYCDRKLEEYSYAPNKIEEVKETSGYIQDEEDMNKIDVEEFLRQKELMMPKSIKKDYKIYQYAVGITKDDWLAILLDSKIVTTSNLEFLICIYCIGDQVGPVELSKETGFSSNYPYKEVMMALGKRIKAKLKVEVPMGEDQKPMWWHLLFNGGFKDNNSFEWSLKTELREAMDLLIAQGKIKKIAVFSEKPLVPLKEEVIKPKDTEKIVEKDESMSAFDRLFASIMSDTLEDKNTPVDKEEVKNPIESVKVNEAMPQEIRPSDNKESIKKACLEYYGAICDLCGFDYGYTYGEAFENMIEVHNIHGVQGEEIEEHTDPIKDLIPICNNCHHVIHSQHPAISVQKMRTLIKA